MSIKSNINTKYAIDSRKRNNDNNKSMMKNSLSLLICFLIEKNRAISSSITRPNKEIIMVRMLYSQVCSI